MFGVLLSLVSANSIGIGCAFNERINCRVVLSANDGSPRTGSVLLFVFKDGTQIDSRRVQVDGETIQSFYYSETGNYEIRAAEIGGTPVFTNITIAPKSEAPAQDTSSPGNTSTPSGAPSPVQFPTEALLFVTIIVAALVILVMFTWKKGNKGKKKS